MLTLGSRQNARGYHSLIGFSRDRMKRLGDLQLNPQSAGLELSEISPGTAWPREIGRFAWRNGAKVITEKLIFVHWLDQ